MPVNRKTHFDQHLFKEPGKSNEAAKIAISWFKQHFRKTVGE